MYGLFAIVESCACEFTGLHQRSGQYFAFSTEHTLSILILSSIFPIFALIHFQMQLTYD